MDYNHISVCLDILQRLQDNGSLVQKNDFGNSAYLADCVKEISDQDNYIQLSELSPMPSKLEDSKAEVQDPLEEVNLGGTDSPRITYIS